jgi:micrococcal nuclease
MRHRRGFRLDTRLPRAPLGTVPLVLLVVLIVFTALRDRPILSRPASAGSWRTEKIHDGDTITLVDSIGRVEKVRLLGIDAPEYRQPHGPEAARALDRLTRGRFLHVDASGRDQFGRLLATLYVDDRNLNRELVAAGHAWVFQRSSPDPDLLAAEAAARTARRGLWSLEAPQSPAAWRAEHPRPDAPQPTAAAANRSAGP